MSSTESRSTEPAARSTPPGANSFPAQNRLRAVAPALAVIGLLAVLVWQLNPRQPRIEPAPLQPVPSGCLKTPRSFVPSNITEIPQWRAGSSRRQTAGAADAAVFGSLPKDQKERALLRANTEPCSCGCKLGVAACRVNEPECDVSAKEAARILNPVRP
jgi:hypothetical protein